MNLHPAVLAALLALPASAQIAPKPAEPATIAANAAAARSMPAPDPQVDADIMRGFIAALPDAETRAADGKLVYTLKGYEFLQPAQGPSTVHPSLWVQARKSMASGLFRVTEGYYQVRGLDLTNMTIVEGKTGLIIIDPTLTAETARSALALYYQHRPRKPVVAVFYNHSHVDHYGGIKGIVDAAEVAAGRVQVIAPAGFMGHAVAENVMAGNAMSRRAEYQFGTTLERGERGQVDLGGAKALSNGTITLIAPTRHVTQALETMVIDGVEIINLLAPGTEAPAELIQYFPQHKVLNTGELALPTQHQLLTMRGAEIRNAHAWSTYLNLALHQFGEGSDILVGQHGWPVFGHQRVVNYLSKQRDLYGWLHDQSLRLINHGYKPVEIAEFMRENVPDSLASEWFAQGYYGSVQRNAKAVYQQYMGWHDGDPAHIDALSPAAYGKQFVRYGGGVAAVLARARADYANGQYRWVAQAMAHVVQAEPASQEARLLGADALEQMGYQAQSAVERNAYLTGAMELRSGGKSVAPPLRTASPDSIRALSPAQIFDYFAVRLNGPKAQGKHLIINWRIAPATGDEQHYALTLSNSALSYVAGHQARRADATLTLSRATLDAMLARQLAPRQAIGSGALRVDGDAQALLTLLGMLDEFAPDFEIVMPHRSAKRL